MGGVLGNEWRSLLVAKRDPGELYADLTRELGELAYDRVEAPANAEQRKRLSALSAKDVHCTELGGEAVMSILSEAPGNHESIGGVKVIAANGWFAARPSGTEDVYKIYAESFAGTAALEKIVEQAQATVDAALESGGE